MDLHDVMVPNSGNPSYIDPNYITEAEMDIELCGAVATQAKISYVYTGGASGYNVFTAVKYAIDNKLAAIVSLSAGGCEPLYSVSNAGASGALDAAVDGSQPAAEAPVNGDSGGCGCRVPRSNAELSTVRGLLAATVIFLRRRRRRGRS